MRNIFQIIKGIQSFWTSKRCDKYPLEKVFEEKILISSEFSGKIQETL